MKKYIAVAGNIGVGKSTLVTKLSAKLEWEPFYEPVQDNPYLADFYKDMKTWSFHSQIFFLAKRLNAHLRLSQHPTSVIQDRSIYEDAEIFARNLYVQGYLSERDYGTYLEIYEFIIQTLPHPDLVIYLRATEDTLLKRITTRGRQYEKGIAEDYLKALNDLYEIWISNFVLCPILAVPADELDFVAHPDHLNLIACKVNEKLSSKDEVIFDKEEYSTV